MKVRKANNDNIESMNMELLNGISNELKRIALEMISDRGYIHIPNENYWFPHPNISIDKVIFYLEKEQVLDVSEVYLEKTHTQKRNLVVQTDSKKYLIDFKLGEYNLIQQTVERNVSIIMIDLSNLSICCACKKLHSILFYKSEYKSLENYYRLETCLDMFKSNIKGYPITKRSMKSKVKKGTIYELSHIDLCPINVRSYMTYNYANLRTDCPSCKYFLYTNNDNVCCMGENTYQDYIVLNNNLLIGSSRLTEEKRLYNNGIALLIGMYTKRMLRTARSSLIFHEELKFMIMDIGVKLGFYSLVEKKCIYTNEHGVQKNGMIDVIWISNKFEVAFEIDSGFRKRSVFKLSKATFKYAFWVVPVTEFIKDYLKNNNLNDRIKLIDIPRYRVLLSKRSNSKY